MGGTFGNIVDSPVTTEIDEVKKIIDCLTEFDTEQKFTEYTSKLTGKITDVEQSIEALKEKMNSQKAIKSEAEIIKSDLRSQYEINYLDARKQMGRKRAEILFPKKNKARAAVEIDTEE